MGQRKHIDDLENAVANLHTALMQKTDECDAMAEHIKVLERVIARAMRVNSTWSEEFKRLNSAGPSAVN